MPDSKLSQQLLDRAPVLSYIKSLDHRFMVVNQLMNEVYEVEPGELIGATNEEAFPDEDLSRVNDLHDRVVAERRAITVEEVINFYGKDHTFLTSRFPLLGPDGDVVAVGGIAVDITERARVLRELHASELRYRHLVEHAAHGFMTFDATTGRFTYANANAGRMFGVPPGSMVGRNIAELSPASQPDGRPSAEGASEFVRRALDGEVVVFDWVHQHDDGTPLPTRIWLSSDGVREVWASLLDMSDIVASQAAMARQKRLLDRTQAIAEVGGWQLDRSSEELTWTLETYRLHGVTPETFTPTLPAALAFLVDADAERFRAALLSVGDRGSFDIEVALVVASGSPQTVRVAGTSEGHMIIGVIQNLTPQRQLEEQLFQSQKLESLGRLAGGIAHDFNNLLTVILNAAEYLDNSGADARSQGIIDIRQATRRAADLTTQMLAFARRSGGSAQSVDPRKVLQRTARMMSRLISEDVRIEIDVSQDAKRISADPAHLEQVVVNLVMNASDAMPNGGVLHLRCRASKRPGSSDAMDGVLVEVEDTGTGMPRHVQRRVFEPFFTTKAPGKGTGLGLSTVYGILQRWDGEISVHSEEGVGTLVQTWWPAGGAHARAISDQGPADKPSTGDETVMLVEDDDAVRRVTARGLRAAGFNVVVADGPDVALRLFEDDQLSVDVLVSDLVMPGLTGIELATRLRVDRPELRVLFISGYAADALEERGLAIGAVDLLTKPFAMAALTRRIRAVLDR